MMSDRSLAPGGYRPDAGISAIRRCRFLAGVIACVLLISVLPGCSDGEGPPPGAESPSEIRIVSLSPAITRTLIDLGAVDLIVGRTGFCRVEDTTIPVVGDLLTLDHERLVKLRPTHVLVQPPQSGIGEDLTRLAASSGWTLKAWRLNGLDDITTLIDDLPSIASTIDPQRHSSLRTRADALIDAMDDLRQSTGSFDGGTLMVSEFDPVLTFGDGSYLDDLLAIHGGRNATDASGWAILTVEDVVRLAPESVIVVRDDGAGESIVAAFRKLDIPAAHNGRIALLSHPEALMPSSAMIDVSVHLREILDGWVQ